MSGEDPARVDPAPQTITGLATNQEMERIAETLAEFYMVVRLQGKKWLRPEELITYLCFDLGYEDQEELEDAMQCSMLEFCTNDHRFSMKVDEDGKHAFSMDIEPPRAEWKPKRLVLKFDKDDTGALFNILYKNRLAELSVPEIEFYIGAEGHKNKNDSVFNHLSVAMMNLQLHAEGAKFAEKELQGLLDCKQAWTLVVDDPTGCTYFSNMDKVVEEEFRGVMPEAREADSWRELGILHNQEAPDAEEVDEKKTTPREQKE